MMQRWRRTFFGIGLITLLVGGAAFGLLASLWLPWHLIPDGDSKVAWTGSALAVLPPLGALPPALDHVAQTAWRGVYQQTGSAAAMVVLPRPRFQRLTPAVLAQAGWQVQRLGPYIYAARGENTLRPLRAAATATLQSLTTSPWPASPAGIIQVAPQGVLGQPLVAVITASGTTWRVVVDHSLTAPRGRHTRLADTSTAGTIIGAPGVVWQRLPENLWDDVLRLGFGFTRTRPAITRTLGTTAHSTIYKTTQGVGGEELAVVAQDPAEQFALAATTWIQEEERRGRLVNRSFRLPDRTQGFEKVPGEALPVFTAPDSMGCRGPLEARTTLWLCRRDTFTALATTRDHALAALAGPRTPALNIQIDRAAFATLQQHCPGEEAIAQVICNLQAVVWQGTPDAQAGRITWHRRRAE